MISAITLSKLHISAKDITDVLQFIFISITGVVGIISLYKDVKDKEGKITSTGKILLPILIFAFILSVGVTILSVHNRTVTEAEENAKTQAQIKNSTAILNNVVRELCPLKDFAISFELSSDLKGAEGFFSYKKRLDGGLKKIIPRLTNTFGTIEINGITPCSYDDNQYTPPFSDRVSGVDILSSSPLYPSPTKEEYVYYQINPAITIYVFKKPIRNDIIEDFSIGWEFSGKVPDLTLKFNPLNSNSKNLFLRYNTGNQFSIIANNLCYDPQFSKIYYDSIISISDLDSAELIIDFSRGLNQINNLKSFEFQVATSRKKKIPLSNNNWIRRDLFKFIVPKGYFLHPDKTISFSTNLY